ncbi:glycosyltransferase family 2 protein [Aestuariirhabdus sp. Z084]|uniref:glycosyltransferase family 2 protein n=1 Tax=Aestuariirhabdus haliotis TaxID=2918751 RepID=UPI00201B3A47|nr:glycosyltransferase family 2 protein [Aestuariirhabdus haliotis]MCL6416090.1 glycosyltransferase family 2 protein [Aestuariirhabdus haliotis]MCL6419342.1 glycosyltransferase family 2 protein [Aestuariirhabdus haliotis]
MKRAYTYSIIIPAKNESLNLCDLLPRLVEECLGAEIIVVNDGSEDRTSDLCVQYDVKEIRHQYSKGNGAAIKAGARAALGEIFVFMDGDGQHNPKEIVTLLDKLDEGYDMVVGARSSSSQASVVRWVANSVYNKLATFMVGHKVDDLTSGFRVVRAEKFREFIYLLPNGFSYPTTSTMAFFRAGYSVGYHPITALKREGKSHINLIKDGVRFLLIIFKVGTLYSPLKLFTPISALFFSLGLSYYAYTFWSVGRFTNMSALLFSTSLLIFLMGLVSEQITMLLYSGSHKESTNKNSD